MGLGTIGSQQRLNYNEKNDTAAKPAVANADLFIMTPPKRASFRNLGASARYNSRWCAASNAVMNGGEQKKSPTGWQK